MSYTIRMYEQVAIGNFGGDTDEERSRAANKFAEILTERLTEYCEINYPDADIDIEFNVENVSGCAKKFECTCDRIYAYPDNWGDMGKYLDEETFDRDDLLPEEWYDEALDDGFEGSYDEWLETEKSLCRECSLDVERDIESKYQEICAELERSGEIYED